MTRIVQQCSPSTGMDSQGRVGPWSLGALEAIFAVWRATSPYRNEPIRIGRNHTAPKFEVRVCPYRAVGTTRELPTPTGAALTKVGVTVQAPLRCHGAQSDAVIAPRGQD